MLRSPTRTTLAEIAGRLGGEIRGEPSTEIFRIASLENASKGAIAFLSNPKYRNKLVATRASAVILSANSARECSIPCIVTPLPYLYFARLSQWLNPPEDAIPGVHPSATVASNVPPSAEVGPGARIGTNVVLGERVRVGANCVIGDNCKIGEGSILNPGAILYHGTHIGRACVVHSNVVIGADGFGFAQDTDQSWLKIPQTGRVRIGDDVEVGAGTCIDRGAIEDTVIEDGVKLDNLIQIAHNVRVGAHTAIAACVGIAGSTEIGKRCTIAGATSIMGHLRIADDVHISLATTVMRSITAPGTYTGTVPSLAHGEWRTNYVHFRHLDSMADKIRSLEKRLADLEKNE